jgi:hypothetical protein
LTCFALIFGLFLGLAILKFGNPVILDQKIPPPASLDEFIGSFWPSHWAIWVWLPLAGWGGLLIFQEKLRWPGGKRVTCLLWVLPLIWLGWQLISSTHSVDGNLSAATLPQLAGCVGCYFLGVYLLARSWLMPWLLAGILLAFTYCLVRAVDQRLFEFPDSYQSLVQDEQEQWTNVPTATFLEMKHEGIIVNTNGVDVANPAILAKFAKGRVNGTLVYPNALAGIILLLFPVALALAFQETKNLKPTVRLAAIAMTIGLGGAAFFFTGSKLGWLLAIALGGLMLFRLNWSTRLKWAVLALVVIVGLGVFAVRFHKYFAAGATSAGARFDYWRAAAQTAKSYPIFGTGPGTFQRPYARLKSSTAEMARLTHNDYLEQFSDSGLIGGLSYLAWIALTLTFIGRAIWRRGNYLSVALLGGILAWFIQGFGEFSLYIPGLAWLAFTLLGALLGLAANEFDKKAPIP